MKQEQTAQEQVEDADEDNEGDEKELSQPDTGEEKEPRKDIPESELTLAVQDALNQIEGKHEQTRENTTTKTRILQDFGKKIGGARKDAAALYQKILSDASVLNITDLRLTANWPAPKYQKLLDAGVEPWKVAAIRALREANLSKPATEMYHKYVFGSPNDLWKARLQESRGVAADILHGLYTRDSFIAYLADDSRGHFFPCEEYPTQDEVGSAVDENRRRIDLPYNNTLNFVDYHSEEGSAYFPNFIYSQIYHKFRMYEQLGHDVSLSKYFISEDIYAFTKRFERSKISIKSRELNHVYILYKQIPKKDRFDYINSCECLYEDCYGHIGIFKTFDEATQKLKQLIEWNKEKNTKKNELTPEEQEKALFEKNKGSWKDYDLYHYRNSTNFWVTRKVSRKLSIVLDRFSLDDCFDFDKSPRSYYHAHLKEYQKTFSNKVGPYLDELKKYRISQDRESKEYIFWRKAGAELPIYKGAFDNLDDAGNYLLDHIADMEKIYKDGREIPFERNQENRARKGTLYDHGDVTPELYQQTFGFRGVEFGNWLTGKERQNRLNESYDAFLDLAQVLEVESPALSLGGTLSIRFGSNGRGGKNAAAAHFEHGYNAINLTKKNGAGCLAHEWFHALDYYLGHKKNIAMLSDDRDEMQHADRKREVGQLSYKSYAAFANVVKTITTDTAINMVRRSAELDTFSGKGGEPYWGRTREMLARAFESYVACKLEEKGIQNDFLVNVKSEEAWEDETKNRDAKYLAHAYPYPTREEMPYVEQAYNKLVAALSTRKVNDRVEFFSCSNRDSLAYMTESSKAALSSELSTEQRLWRDFSQQRLGIPVLYYEGPKELHGCYDSSTGMIYLNQQSELDYRWTFYHEAFHALKHKDRKLYQDLLKAVEDVGVITKAQMNAYRENIHAKDLSDDLVKEEMLADAFADQKAEAHAISKVAQKQTTLATRLMRFTRRIADQAKTYFTKQDQAGLTVEQAVAFRERLEYIAQNMRVNGRNVLSDRHNILGLDGYPIVPEDMEGRTPHLSVPYPHQKDRQQYLDEYATQELLKIFSPQVVTETLQVLSPQRSKGYADNILRDCQVVSSK